MYRKQNFPVRIIHKSLNRDHLIELFEGHLQIRVLEFFLPLGMLATYSREDNTFDLLGKMSIQYCTIPIIAYTSVVVLVRMISMIPQTFLRLGLIPSQFIIYPSYLISFNQKLNFVALDFSPALHSLSNITIICPICLGKLSLLRTSI